MSLVSFAQLAHQIVPGVEGSVELPILAESPKPDPSHLKLTGRATGLSCPSCETPTQFAEAMGVLVVACPSCFGFLTQGKDFSGLIDAVRKTYHGVEIARPVDRSHLKVKRTCPTCFQPFETHTYAGPGTAVVDSCQTCETIWLDGGELERIEQAPGRR